jgi:hypothetical protein
MLAKVRRGGVRRLRVAASRILLPVRGGERPQVEAFSRWLKEEFAALDWTILDALTQNTAARKSPS